MISLLSGTDLSIVGVDRLKVPEDAPGTPIQSHMSPSILVYEEIIIANPAEAEMQGYLAHEKQPPP